MSDSKKPVVGQITPLSQGSGPKGPIVLPSSPVLLTNAQFAQLQRTLVVCAVTMGWMANGMRPGSEGRKAELASYIKAVEELL